jgi:hypothetical protein
MNHNRFYPAFIGSCIGVIIARAYVEAGGPLGIMVYGRVLHHVDYGIALLILTLAAILGVKAIGSRIPWGAISGVIGFSVALIIDEINIFMNFGSRYTLALYNDPVNVIADLILVLSLLAAARMPSLSGLRHIELQEAAERQPK